MKKLILKFLALCVLFVVIMILVTMLCFIQNKKQANQIFLPKHIEKIYIGDSHIQKGINDSLLSHAINMGMTSEATLFSYFKLLKILPNNPQIKKIFLGFSYNNMSQYYDDCIFKDYAADISTKYMCMIPDTLNQKIMTNSIRKWHHILHMLYRRSVHNTFSTDPTTLSYFGAYVNTYRHTKSDTAIVRQRIQDQLYAGEQSHAISQIQIQSLLQIQALCQQHHIELYILNTPLDPYYQSLIPSNYVQQYDSLMKATQLQVIDFHNLTFEPQDFIPDGDHVSVTGARKISQYLEKNF